MKEYTIETVVTLTEITTEAEQVEDMDAYARAIEQDLQNELCFDDAHVKSCKVFPSEKAGE